MAAPTITAPQSPAGGARPNDGHKTLVVLANAPTAALWILSVKPPAIEMATFELRHMNLNEWAQMAIGSLKKMGPISGKALYDPVVYSQLSDQVGVNQAVSVHWPNHAAIAVWAALTKLDPDENSEGNPQTMSFEITPTMADPASGNAEADFTYAAGGGTGA